MTEPYKGRVVIAPDVLTTVARLAALSVPGVARMAAVPGGVNRFFGRAPHQIGVRLTVHDQHVHAEVHLVAFASANIREVGLLVQQEVARAIENIVGMQVNGVNIHVEDVTFDAPAPKSATHA